MCWKAHWLGQRPAPPRCLCKRGDPRLAGAVASAVLKPLALATFTLALILPSSVNQEPIKARSKTTAGAARSLGHLEVSPPTGQAPLWAQRPCDAMPLTAQQPPEEPVPIQSLLKQYHLSGLCPGLGVSYLTSSSGQDR